MYRSTSKIQTSFASSCRIRTDANGISACFLIFGCSSGLYNRVETQPGLDQFSSDPDGLRDQSLGPLLEWAHAVVPERQWSSTPLFMLATAGLRKLPEAEQKALMEGARGVLARSGFRSAGVIHTYVYMEQCDLPDPCCLLPIPRSPCGPLPPAGSTPPGRASSLGRTRAPMDGSR